MRQEADQGVNYRPDLHSATNKDVNKNKNTGMVDYCIFNSVQEINVEISLD